MHSSSLALAPPPAGILAAPYRAVTLGMLALISLLAFEHLAVATVMPGVAQALGDLSLYAAAFGAAMASSIVGMVLAGRWSDRAGPAPALFAGCLGFVVGVLAVGSAPGMPLLVLGRAVQGLGGGMMSVALYVVVGAVYPARLHPRIFAAFAAAWVVPVIVGPAIAGLIASQLGWRWVFLSAAVLALPAAWLVRQGLAGQPAATPPGAAGPARPGEVEQVAEQAAERPRSSLWVATGAAVSAALLYAGGGSGGGAWLAAVGLCGVLLLAPRLLPAGSLRGRAGLPAVIALRGLAAAAFFAGEVLLPLMLSSQRGLGAVQAGLVLTVGALGWSAGSWWQGRERPGPVERRRQHNLRFGMAAIAVGLLSTAAVLLPAVPVWAAALSWTVAGVGIGLVYPTLSVLTLACAAPAEQGAASSALQLSDALFSAVGLAVASALLAALQARWPMAAYAAGLLAAALLALLGLLLAPRARPLQAPAG